MIICGGSAGESCDVVPDESATSIKKPPAGQCVENINIS